jgi:hypothetical protein
MTSLMVAGLGLICGGYVGFWSGVLVGASMVEAARVSCFDGGCATVALSLALTGAAVGGAIGLVVSLMRRLRAAPRSATHSFS